MQTKSNKLKIFISITLIGLITLNFSGCVEQKPEQTLSEELNILNWEDYFGPTTLEDFEEEYGVKVNLNTFEDEDIMVSLLETNPGDYDLAVTSDSTISELITMKSLAEIDKENIPNFNNLDSDFLNLNYDSENKYSIPYFWGTTGVAFDTSKVDENTTSWAILFDTNFSGDITMLNNKEEVIGAALKYLGYSINSNNLSQLQEAEQLLIQQKSLIQGYDDPITIIDKLSYAEVAIAHSYVGESYWAMVENENISYIIPKEGAPLWIDSFIIPIDSPNKYTAEVFINYILDKEICAEITNYQWTATPNEAAEIYLDTELLEDSNIYPPESILEKCEFFEELNDITYSEHNRIWAILQS